MDEACTIDRAGRVVIPAVLRHRLHLVPGTRLRIREDGERLILQPLAAGSGLSEKEGLLVAEGRLMAGDIDHRRVREERLDGLGFLR